MIACDYVMGIKIPFYDDWLFHLAEDLTRRLWPIFNISFGLVYLLNGVGEDKVARSHTCRLWDLRYFDGGYDMIASL